MPFQKSPLCPDVDCPPEDAEPTDGVFLRICRFNPPRKDDLLSKTEERATLAKPDARPIPTGQECAFCAISLFTKASGARRQAKDWMKRRYGVVYYLASGQLKPKHGVHDKPSKRGHTNWWNDAGLAPSARAALFTVTETVKK